MEAKEQSRLIRHLCEKGDHDVEVVGNFAVVKVRENGELHARMVDLRLPLGRVLEFLSA